MQHPHLHIVSFNVPYPADYGGVIDVFYRIKALAALGIDIHLHAFTYGREASPELLQYCKSVDYYKRKTGFASAFSTRPYIVVSRDNEQLLSRLRCDDYPILLEGLHCCSVLESLENRCIFVRAHNVEHEYYSRLAQTATNTFRRIYLRTDARRLLRYEPVLKKASAVLAVTQADADHFRSIGCGNVLLMPSSHQEDEVISKTGTGEYIFYHADLSVPDNIKAVGYLAENIFPDKGLRFVVAGRSPSPAMQRSLAQFSNVRLVPNPDDSLMQQLIADAHIHFMVTHQPTGLKLKLLNSLYAGRHCLVNSYMVAGTDLHRLCTVADTPSEQLAALHRLMQTPFSQEEIELRRSLLGKLYSNRANARIIFDLI